MRKLLVILMISSALSGCGPTDNQLQTWQDASAQLGDEISIYEQELAATTDPATRAGLEATVAEMKRQYAIFDKAIRAAEDASDIPWAIGETLVGILAGFLPVAGIALPFIRTLRKQRESIFKAVDKAKAVLKENPAAVAALSKWKTANGNV